MSSSPGATYATGERARCIASVPGNGERTVFAVGTRRLRGNNAVLFVAHDRDRDALVARGVYEHRPEILDLRCSPTTDTLVATLYDPTSASPDHGGAVWRVPDDGADARETASLQSVAPFADAGARASRGAARCVRWRAGVGVDPSAPATGGTLAVADAEARLRLFQLDASASSALACVAESSLEPSLGEPTALDAPAAGAWDPHAADAFAAVSAAPAADGVCVYDTRTMRVAIAIANPPAARRAGCRFADVEFDPRLRWRALTAGDDGLVRAWDLRRAAAPTCTRAFAGHEHWVRQVCANPVYELLATASADGTARLWRDEWSGSGDDGEDGDESDAKARRRRNAKSAGGDEEGASFLHPVETYGAAGYPGAGVCGVAWSAADPWSFASLEGDGTVALRAVPRAEKYRILL